MQQVTSGEEGHPSHLLRHLLHRIATLILISLVVSFSIDPANCEAISQSRSVPNIVLILADDLGYGQLGCYPHEGDARSPNIDRLAAGGVLMTDGYSAHPMCWPSRASILTGRYYQRFKSVRPVPDTERMIAQYLAEAGYTSACIGKWHNTGSIGTWDGQEENHPRGWGFQEFFGFLGGMHDYYDVNLGTHFVDGANRPYPMPIYDGVAPVPKAQYLTQEFTDRALDFVERHARAPFFLFLSYNAVHTPMQAPPEYVERSGGDVHAAMLDVMDEGVGRLLDALERLGIDGNTLVLFVGDNGGYGGKNWKLRGQKSFLYEGGIRVPLVASWPGTLPGGRVYQEPVMHIDVLPTLLAAAGVEVPADHPLDGVNLLPYWRGEASGPPHEVLFWGEPDGRRLAVRQGPSKLIQESPERGEPAVAGLFRLDEDVAESDNLLEKNKPLADELRRRFDDWAAQMRASR